VRLLVTRSEPDGERTAAALRGRNHDVLVAPLLRTESVPLELPPTPFRAVVMTSANAARAVARHPQRARFTALPAFTVGGHTADEARAAGFRDVRSADGDRRDLLALLRSAGEGPLLYLAGADRAGELDACGVPVTTVVAYRAVKAVRFPAEVETALIEGRLDGVLHFSRRSAEAYLECAGRVGILDRALAPLHFGLSQQVAEPLTAAGARVRIAPRPGEAALLALVG
jgi:uroporphyrinogen-III synthase